MEALEHRPEKVGARESGRTGFSSGRATQKNADGRIAVAVSGGSDSLALMHLLAAHARSARREPPVVLDQVEPEGEDRLVIVRPRGANRELGRGGYFTTRCSLARIMRRLPDLSPSLHLPPSSSAD